MPAEGGERRLIGLMSGTSCDGVDAVACTVTGVHGAAGKLAARLVAHRHAAYEPDFAARLLVLGGAAAPELARVHVELGRRFGRAAAEVMAAAGWAAASVAAVACPGHTAVHLPPEPGDPGATLALGDGDVVAEICGALVVADLRARDRAAGGQGAPLVPYADACLLRRPDRIVAALNLGGIGNLTVIPPLGDPLAFDTGPANMLLDAALTRASGGRLTFDAGGLLGLAGRADRAWVERALAEDAFLSQPPPRSTGRERYGSAFLERHWGQLGALALPDLAATLAAHVVATVRTAFERFVPRRPAELIVSGGGAANRCVMEGLAASLQPMLVRDSETALGLPAQAREALAFALLADATLAGAAGNLPSVTGAARAVRLGKLCLPPAAGLHLPPLGGERFMVDRWNAGADG